MRGYVCRLQLPQTLASAVIRGSESRRTHRLRFEILQSGGTGPRIYIPQEQGGPVITPGTGFPIRLLLLLSSGTRINLSITFRHEPHRKHIFHYYYGPTMSRPLHGNPFTEQLPNDRPGIVDVFTGCYQATAVVLLFASRSLSCKVSICHNISVVLCFSVVNIDIRRRTQQKWRPTKHQCTDHINSLLRWQHRHG
jgi:hypothetical protein